MLLSHKWAPGNRVDVTGDKPLFLEHAFLVAPSVRTGHCRSVRGASWEIPLFLSSGRFGFPLAKKGMAAAPSAKSGSSTSSHTDQLRALIQRRGGRWGCRAFRIALASLDVTTQGQISRSQLIEALGKFGVAGLSSLDIDALMEGCGSALSDAHVVLASGGAIPTTTIDAVMSFVNPRPLSAIRYAAVCRLWKAFAIDRQSGEGVPCQRLVLRDICEDVQMQLHPDVQSGAVKLGDALLCFFSMWGVGLVLTVSESLFAQFFAELSIGFSHDE